MIKRILSILTLLLAFNSLSQTATYRKISKNAHWENYISKAGDTLSIGDYIEILDPRSDVFTYITQGNISAGPIISGTSPAITKIKSVGTKKRGYKIFLGFKGYGLLTVWIDYENALRSSEVTLDQ